MRGPKESGFKDFRSHPTGQVKQGILIFWRSGLWWLKRCFSLQIDPEGPSYDEWVIRRNQSQKNNHLRWEHVYLPFVWLCINSKRQSDTGNWDQHFRNSPFGAGFHEPKFKKLWFWQRYPVLFHRVFVSSCLLVFFRWLARWWSCPILLFQQTHLRHIPGPPTHPTSLREGRVLEEADAKERMVGRSSNALVKEEGCIWRLEKDRILRPRSRMDSVSKARTRLGKYPVLFAACAPQAAAYGKCVGEALGEVQKNQCAAQFQDFMKCVKQEAKRLGTRLWLEAEFRPHQWSGRCFQRYVDRTLPLYQLCWNAQECDLTPSQSCGDMASGALCLACPCRIL